jgi:cell fate (sporulation/competence/biofilm development) regulator YlbF (YheA/YmcA/DUF963 family)
MENKTVIALSKELAAVIVESEEYQNYKEVRRELEKNPQLAHDVDELRKFNFLLQNTEDVNDMYDEVTKIFEQYAYLRNNVVSNRFLRYEMRLCRMVQEMIKTIFEEIDFNVDFIE